MQAVILAGGLGTRLWPLTREIPKPMARVAGRPYLEHPLRLLREQGITNVVLLVGYLGRQIEEHFGPGRDFGLSIRYSREETPLGTGGGLRDARPLLAETFLLLYGDSYLPIDYRPVLAALNDRDTAGVMVVYDNRRGNSLVRNNVALAPDGRVARYDKVTEDDPGLTHVEAGALAFRRSVIDRIPPAGKASLENDVYPALVAARQMRGFATEQRFYDIGTPERIRILEDVLSP
jgi:NDP-sugar pyrophosphorylase family protein